jgi:hypothetical protein
MNQNIRQRATMLAANASPKKRALVDEWIAASIRFETDGQHILANKAAFNAGGIASGMTPMKSCPISIAAAWGN